MENLYADAPLNLREQEIRVVKLEHSHVSEPIKCSLRTYKLDNECPTYVALSYVWGIKNQHEDILFNGHPFPIGRSLWSFLHQMRLQHQYITFWIDAISINQANVLEQNHQVQMMREIYTHAHSVWVWLGEADNLTHSDIGMQYIKTREPFGDRDVNYKKMWSPRKARAVLGLCERGYWKRIWIVQEIMLAKKATILCGDERVDWRELQQLISDLQQISDKGRAMHTTGVSDVLESPATVIVRAKSQWDGTLQPLTSLLEKYHNQESTDIRDKVYALHGLASNSDGIAIDYRIDPKALLVEIIYHTCSVQASKTDQKRSKKELLRFAKMVRDALKVMCMEEELDFHVEMARGDGRSFEKDYELRVLAMESRTGQVNHRYGVVPLSADKYYVLLIQSTRRAGWVLPNGGWETDEATAEEAAKREAWEEAGITCKINYDLGSIAEKRKPDQLTATAPQGSYNFFEATVEQQLAVWPKQHKHQRQWFTYTQARAALAEQPELLDALDRCTMHRT